MSTEANERTDQRSAVARYFRRMRGTPGATVHPRVRPLTVLIAFVGCFVGIYVIAIPTIVDLTISTKFFLIGSFGASAALLFGAPHAPVAQPRSLIGGQTIAAICGVTAFKLFTAHLGVAAGLAVASATAIMLMTGSLHPPAGATALIAVLGPAKVHSLGYVYILSPVLFGVFVLLVLAVLMNNLSPEEQRHYPVSWW
jgi:CBS-domain-containing membrane protein